LPDYRAAVHYFEGRAREGDLVVLVDEPALGAEVVEFYRRSTPTLLVRDSRDPRLKADKPAGDIYWVVSFFQNDPEFLRELSESDPRWGDAAFFDRIVVLRERGPVVPTEGLSRLVEKLEEKLPSYQPVRTLRGVLLQADGRALPAADLYGQTEAYYPRLGAEFLVSARGYLERGDRAKAWREALTSLFMEPRDPRIHDFIAQLLAVEGYSGESSLAQQVARELGIRD
jgi:hypothetical protein